MAELKPYNPSWRESTKQYIAGALSNLGMDNYRAQKTARGFTGSMRPDLNIAESMGVLDFTPAGLVFAGDESVKGLKDAESALDYAIEVPIAALTFGEGLAKSYPVTKSLTNFLKKQARKFKSPSIADEIVNEQLIGSASPKNKKELGALSNKTIDKDKRKTLKTLATVPVAAVAATEPLIGALGNVPKGKVAKKVFKKLPKSKFDIPALINQVDEAVELGFRENIDMIDDDEAVQFIKDLFYEKEMKKIGIDPKNITHEDLLNDEVVHYLKREPVNPNAYIDEQDLLEMMNDEISDYLSGKLDLDDLNQGASGAYNFIKSLHDDYNLDKDGISKYLDIPIGKIPKSEIYDLEIPPYGGGRMGNKQFIGHIRDSSQIDLAIEQFKKDNPRFADNKFHVIDKDIDGNITDAEVWIEELYGDDFRE